MSKKIIKNTSKNEKQLYLPLTTEFKWINELNKDLQRKRKIKKTDCGKITNIEYTQSYNKEVQGLGQRIEQLINNP